MCILPVVTFRTILSLQITWDHFFLWKHGYSAVSIPFNWASPSRLINPTIIYKYAQREKRADTISTAGSLRCFNHTGCNNSSICASYAWDQVSFGLFCYFVFNISFQWGHACMLRISVLLREARTAVTLLELLRKSKLLQRITLKTEKSMLGTHAD